MSYFIHLDGEAKGPYTSGQLRSMWHSGAVTGDTLYCEEGYEEWLHLRVLADELERPQQPPSLRKSLAPPIVPQRRGLLKRSLAIASLAILGVALVLWSLGRFVDDKASVETNEPMAVFGIASLNPITVRLNDELLKVLKMTDKLDVLCNQGCSSAEYIAAGGPAESAASKLQSRFPEEDPRRDLLVNTFEGYQSVALAIIAKEKRLGSEPIDALLMKAKLRKHLLTRILEGHMTQSEVTVYEEWRKSMKQ